MSTVNITDFRNFVNRVAAETPERQINHHMWEDCAVGDFIREDLNEDFPDDWMEFNDEIFNGYSDLHHFLNQGDTEDKDTYGELAETLKSFDDEGNRIKGAA